MHQKKELRGDRFYLHALPALNTMDIQINELEIEGYRSYGEKQVIAFEPGQLYLLTGDNRDRGISSAAGKSTIIKALTCCLFEETDDDCVEDRGINTLLPEMGCRIATSLTIDGTPIYIVYARSHIQDGTQWTLYRHDGTDWQ